MIGQMQKKFGLLLAVLFLAVQTASVSHMARHGFAEHKHNGHTCDLYFFSEHAKSTSLPAAAAVPIPASLAAWLPSSFFIALTEDSYQPSFPRAPPALLS